MNLLKTNEYVLTTGSIVVSSEENCVFPSPRMKLQQMPDNKIKQAEVKSQGVPTTFVFFNRKVIKMEHINVASL